MSSMILIFHTTVENKINLLLRPINKEIKLVSVLANYIFGVKCEDNFRSQLGKDIQNIEFTSRSSRFITTWNSAFRIL